MPTESSSLRYRGPEGVLALASGSATSDRRLRAWNRSLLLTLPGEHTCSSNNTHGFGSMRYFMSQEPQVFRACFWARLVGCFVAHAMRSCNNSQAHPLTAHQPRSVALASLGLDGGHAPFPAAGRARTPVRSLADVGWPTWRPERPSTEVPSPGPSTHWPRSGLDSFSGCPSRHELIR